MMRSILTTRAVLAALIVPVLVAMAAVMPVAAVELTQRCTNPEEGYTANLPRGWYYNETVEADDTDDVAASAACGLLGEVRELARLTSTTEEVARALRLVAALEPRHPAS